jgi:hypothetical protein
LRGRFSDAGEVVVNGGTGNSKLARNFGRPEAFFEKELNSLSQGLHEHMFPFTADGHRCSVNQN